MNTDPDRKRLGEVRRLLVQAFMTEDEDTFARCVMELEDLIGVPHGDRNPKGVATEARLTQKRAAGVRARKFRWGDRSLEAERHDDGTLVYSITYDKKTPR